MFMRNQVGTVTDGARYAIRRAQDDVVMDWEKEERLERLADALLGCGAEDAEAPTTTELQFARRGRRTCGDALLEDSEAPPTRQALRELAERIPEAGLDEWETFCIRGWLTGITQYEMVQMCRTQLPAGSLPVKQQHLSRGLRRALNKCLHCGMLSFREFSHHTVYRKPHHLRPEMSVVRCRFCGEPYPRGMGDGVYCSISCRCAAAHYAEADKAIRR